MHILLAQAIGEVISHRDQVRRFFNALEPETASLLTLDFTGVTDVSRSAMHQVLMEERRLLEGKHEHVLVGLSQDLERLMDIVRATQYASAPVINPLPVIRLDHLHELEARIPNLHEGHYTPPGGS